MADEPISFYPPDLPLQIANVIEGAHTLDVHRLGGKGKRIVAREHLTVDGQPTPHGKHPDRSDEEIAAAIWEKASADAEQHCKGFARYKAVAIYNKPPRGFAADAKFFEFEVGDPPLRTVDEAHRDSIIVEMNSLLAARHKEQIELLRETTKLAEAVGKMATGLASAWSSVHEKANEDKQHTLELAVLNSEREGERERMRLFEKSLVPMLRLLQGKRGGQLALTEGESKQPEIVRVARKLGESLTVAQLDYAAKVLGRDRLRELASVENEAEVLALTSWLFDCDEAKVLDVYGQMRDDQVPMVDRLQELAAEAGEKHGEQKQLAAGE